ncbi:MAG: dihydropteroate synthase [Candidatus Lokiarchaeota archaeon]|nr:dihydropteroate synthase [Candidatus Lokiarchaeota archaeon]
MTGSASRIHVRIHGLDIGDGFPVRIMGVLNLSRESFYKRSVVDAGGILERGREMIARGAAMLDVGGRSTAPNVQPISVDDERARVVAALNALLPGLENDKVLVSIDTQFEAVAASALDIFRSNGMEDQFMINDVSGLHGDPNLPKWIADTGTPCIIMASHGRPGDSLGVGQTIADLQQSISTLRSLGYNVCKKAIVDPAIGRWIPEKAPPYDLELLSDLESFRVIGLPLLVAVSRKSFIGEVLGETDPENRLYGSLSATAIAVSKGAHVVRTHDVTKETIDTIRMADAIRKKTYEKQSP